MGVPGTLRAEDTSGEELFAELERDSAVAAGFGALFVVDTGRCWGEAGETADRGDVEPLEVEALSVPDRGLITELCCA